MVNVDRTARPGEEGAFLHTRATPEIMSEGADVFVAEVLTELNRSGIPYIVAGTYAVSAYTGIRRPTKDLDIFCRSGDFPRILDHFRRLGYQIRVKDDRWLGKIIRGEHFFDVIFASSNGTMPVNDGWLRHGRAAKIGEVQTSIIGATELVFSKCFIQVRHRYDGADVVHVILRAHDQIDWHRLLDYMEIHWELLLIHLLNFRWIYPSQRGQVPEWLLDELLGRLEAQRHLPVPETKICRGRLLSSIDYEIDVLEWNYGDIGSNGAVRQMEDEKDDEKSEDSGGG